MQCGSNSARYVCRFNLRTAPSSPPEKNWTAIALPSLVLDTRRFSLRKHIPNNRPPNWSAKTHTSPSWIDLLRASCLPPKRRNGRSLPTTGSEVRTSRVELSLSLSLRTAWQGSSNQPSDRDNCSAIRGLRIPCRSTSTPTYMGLSTAEARDAILAPTARERQSLSKEKRPLNS